MKLTYSIAILLGITFVQCISAEKPEAMLVKRREMSHEMVATALRRRAKSFSRRNNDAYFYQPGAPQSNQDIRYQPNSNMDNNRNIALGHGPVITVDTVLSQILSSIKALLASDDDSSNDNGEEHEHSREDKLKEKARKDLIKLVKDLAKAINKFLAESGSTKTLNVDSILKAAKDNRLYSPNTQNKRAVEQDQEKSNPKASEAAQEAIMLAEQVAGFSAQMDDGDSKAGAAIIPEVKLLVGLVSQQNA